MTDARTASAGRELRPAKRHEHILHDFLTDAASQGEEAVARVRIAVAVLVLLRLFALGGFDWLWTGHAKSWLAALGTLAGVAVSLWVLRTIRHRTLTLGDRIASVICDAVICGWVLLPGVIWPPSDFAGLLRTPDTAVLLLAVIGGGFRLDGKVAVIGGAAVAAVGLALVGLDLHLNQAHPNYSVDFGEYAIVTIYLLCATGLASQGAARSRRLVFAGANAALRAEQVRQRLGVYVSEELVQEVLKEPGAGDRGDRRPVAVLFSDLRNFTGYASKLPPERLVQELNAYLDTMVQAIRAEGGVVDKYIGDAIMVVFGIPHAQDDDALRAVRTAVAMQAALQTHNAARVAEGLPALRQGIGVHYGPVVAGNIGPPERLQYTVLGDTVNLASRLESATKAEGVPVLLSKALVEAAQRGAHDADAPAPPVAPHGTITVRGAAAPIEVYTLTDDALPAPPAPDRGDDDA